jgi:tetratricopeptide (TPR) repeat protein
MKPAPAHLLVLGLLFVTTFGLATVFQPRAEAWKDREASASVLNVLLGDSKRLFANHAFAEADLYFHSGYYPSIFDQAEAPKGSRHMTSEEGSPEAESHEREMNFLVTPRDWIERMGRNFMITEHTHLEGGNEREILPWLKLSAELDPQRIDTYTVASFWLRNRLGKPAEAEAFLREGLRNNPNNYELLFELGRLYNENYSDPKRALHVWELALKNWQEVEPKQKNPDLVGLEQMLIQLARLEEKTGNLSAAIKYLEMATSCSPNPALLQQQISDLKAKLDSSPDASPSNLHSANK